MPLFKSTKKAQALSKNKKPQPLSATEVVFNPTEVMVGRYFKISLNYNGDYYLGYPTNESTGRIIPTTEESDAVVFGVELADEDVFVNTYRFVTTMDDGTTSYLRAGHNTNGYAILSEEGTYTAYDDTDTWNFGERHVAESPKYESLSEGTDGKITMTAYIRSDNGRAVFYYIDGGDTANGFFHNATNRNDSILLSTFIEVEGPPTQDESDDAYETANDTTLDNICFPAGTPVETDQGIVEIQKVNLDKHTIGHEKIIAVTRSTPNEDQIVCISKGSLDENTPTADTRISLNHKVSYQGHMVKAKDLVARGVPGVSFESYDRTMVLYNILQEKHATMQVNGMSAETLNPTDLVAKIYNIENASQKSTAMQQFNQALETGDMLKYKWVEKTVDSMRLYQSSTMKKMIAQNLSIKI